MVMRTVEHAKQDYISSRFRAETESMRQAQGDDNADIVGCARGERDRKLEALIAAVRAESQLNEQLAFRRLSDALTGGNAATWDEVFDAAEAAEVLIDASENVSRLSDGGCAPVLAGEAGSTLPSASAIIGAQNGHSDAISAANSQSDNTLVGVHNSLLSPRSIPADGVEEAKKQIARILVQSEKPVCLSFTEDMSDPGYCKRCDYAEYCHDERDEAWKVIDAINEQQQARIAELEAQVDAFQQAERIDSLTDEELLAEMRARGEDTDQIAADTRALLNRTLEAFKAKQALLACQPPRHADNCASRFCECGEEGYVNKEDECDGHRRQPCDCGLGQPPHAQERKRHDPSDTPTS